MDPTTPAATTSALLAALRSATADDVKGVEARLAEIQKEEGDLKHLRDLLRKRLGLDVPPPLPAAEPSAAADAAPLTSERRKRIAALLARAGGLRAAAIGRDLGLEGQAVSRCLKCDYFQCSPTKVWTLTPEGRRTLLDAEDA